MRLRKQLFFISLVTLALPWVGCQYVREMETTLQTGQADALLATSRAVAAHLGNHQDTANYLKQLRTPEFSTSIYAHSASEALNVDGYNDEWKMKGYYLQKFQNESTDNWVQLTAAVHNETLFVFMRIKDSDLSYYNPSHTQLDMADHINVYLQSQSQRLRAFSLFASAPGNLLITQHNVPEDGFIQDSSFRSAKDSVQREYSIKGRFMDWQGGYQVEFQLPLAWADSGLGFSVFNADNSFDPKDDSNYYVISNLPKPIRFSDLPLPARRKPSISSRLELFAGEGVRLRVASHSGFYLAESGELHNDATKRLEQQHGLVLWFYRVILKDYFLPSLDEPQKSGRFDTPEISAALRGEAMHAWYQHGQQQVVRVSTPIFDPTDKSIIGAVIADQSADSLARMTNQAFNRLIFYSLITSTVSALVLVLYASWLSFRIRLLGRAARDAVSENGKISDDFPTLRGDDEIAELSRNYGQLLARLREYTNYLKTLSSKLSHELRTPLAIVKSSLDNLEHASLNKQAKIYSERASEGVSRLSTILNAMSAASRVEEAISSADVEKIPCDQILKHLKDAYEDVYKHVRFSLNIRGEAKQLSIYGSGELLVQMMDKLVDNAADFCPSKGRIELGLYSDGDWVVFTIHNDGPPLPNHMHGQLFDSMVSVREPGPKQNKQHLGLGLYIVRLIVDFHRGTVQGYNLPDQSGVMFEVRLPKK